MSNHMKTLVVANFIPAFLSHCPFYPKISDTAGKCISADP